MNIAIIPARGGSKRIPGKNIRPFAGQPMLAWSIQAAEASGLFARIIVSTDSEEIAAVARQYGAEVPFVRPAELADDFTPTAEVVLHALEWLAGEGTKPERVCCLYATAPFVRAGFLRQGYELMQQTDAASVFPVASYPASPFRALTIGQDGRLAMLWPEHELTRSNDLPEAYHDAGQFYWLDVARFRRDKKIYACDARPVVLPRRLVQDIDTLEDWRTAEAMHQALRMTGEIA
ncbi:MAG: pseudaminic acid cytidylyltransferase [Desulfobulbaceae bacterium]|nr:pseudaminic acid cytidylyltransferase [Desulfobulbaceae bacterium]HIJ90248.1 pseudaminic acid cytidylyltransferase [Deltaproteobacteria bacterium]